MEINTLLLVAAGGGTGAVLRYLIANFGQSLTVSSFPLGTLLVNIIGCVLIGFATVLLIDPLANHRETLRLLFIVGMLGGFTTFSTFALDTFNLIDAGKGGQALLYVSLSNIVGIIAAWGAYRLGGAIFTTTTA
jgi:CrcB protein